MSFGTWFENVSPSRGLKLLRQARRRSPHGPVQNQKGQSMNRSLIRLGTIFALGLLCVPANVRQCKADIIYSDSTFNLADYFQVSYLSNPQQATITVSQTLAGGDPGAALQILVSGSPGASFTLTQGLINTSFVYNPGANWPLVTVMASVDKYIQTSGNLTSNFFRPLILQNGGYYISGIPLSTAQGTWFSGGPNGLVASDFGLFDFNTGLSSPTLNPDFSSGLMQFGFANRNSLSSPPDSTSSADIRYDNLVVDLQAASVPEPSGLTLYGLGILGMLLGGRIKRSRAVRIARTSPNRTQPASSV